MIIMIIMLHVYHHYDFDSSLLITSDHNGDAKLWCMMILMVMDATWCMMDNE